MLKNSGPFRRKALEGWMRSMSAQEKLPPVYDTLLAEILQRQGFTATYKPASLCDLAQTFEALENFSPEHDTRIDSADESVQAGLALAWKCFAKTKGVEPIKPMRLLDVQYELKGEKSAGLTWLHSSKAEAMEYGLGRAGQILQGSKKPNPCLAGVRTQAKEPEKGEEYKGKTRLVWAYPLEMTLIEGKFAVPIYSIMKKKRTPMMFARAKHEVGALIDSFVKSTGDCVYGLDYSKFDSTIPSFMIRFAFKVIRTWFDFQDSEDQEGWDTMVKYFIHTPIVMSDGNLYTGKKHGVPSGSYFTQLVDSIVNVALIGALSHSFGMKISHRNFFVLGDDVILSTYKGCDLSKVADYLRETFGIILHPHKCEVGNAHFLGADWPIVTPTRKLQELVDKGFWPESYRKFFGDTYEQKLDDAQTVLLSYSMVAYNAWKLVYYRNFMGKCYNDATISTWYKQETNIKYLAGYQRYRMEYSEKESISTYTLQCLR